MDSKPCPTHGGTKMGYIVQCKNSDGIWKTLPLEGSPCGVPRSKFGGEVYSLMDMFSYESAMAIAWAYKAKTGLVFGMRIVPHKIEYELKAYKEEPVELDMSEYSNGG